MVLVCFYLFEKIKNQKELSNSKFDSSYNSNVSEEYSSSAAKEKAVKSREYVKILYVFNPERAGDLGLNKSDVIVVMKKNSNGWWLGHNQNTNKTGYFPSNFVSVHHS